MILQDTINCCLLSITAKMKYAHLVLCMYTVAARTEEENTDCLLYEILVSRGCSSYSFLAFI
jgi:hypothetical protein